MSTKLPQVTLSYRGSSSTSSPLKGQLRLYRGVYVQLPFDPNSAKPWDIWESIARHASLRQYSKENRHHLSLAAHRFYSTGYKAGSQTQTLSCISRSAGQASSFLHSDARQSPYPRLGESIVAALRSPQNARGFQACLPNTLTMRSSAAQCTMMRFKPSPLDAAPCVSGAILVIYLNSSPSPDRSSASAAASRVAPVVFCSHGRFQVAWKS